LWLDAQLRQNHAMCAWSRTGKAAGFFAPIVLVACGANGPEDVLRARAASDFKCTPDEVNVTEIAGTTYRAKGCGENSIYDCAMTSAHGRPTYLCIPEGERRGGSDEE
jgi:hypothetical protein